MLSKLSLLVFLSVIMAAPSPVPVVDYAKAPYEEKPLYVPTLAEISQVIQKGLTGKFEEVRTDIVVSPDFTEAPFNLSTPGICGNERIVEVGGVPYLAPLVRRDKIYDLAALMRHVGRLNGSLIGAGAGPWPYAKVNCEGVVDLTLNNGVVKQGTRIVTVDPPGAAKGSSNFLLKQLPNNETRSALLGNYLLSDGVRGSVVHVFARRRIGADNFITCIRDALTAHFGERPVGIGGVVLIREGRLKIHVMPDFSTEPLNKDEDVDRWLHFFEAKTPFVLVGTLVTQDMDLDLRLQHFHGWGAHHDGGHYHYDTTPNEVLYEAYLVPGKALIRVDRPIETHSVGRD